jgi:hypothetical protein
MSADHAPEASGLTRTGKATKAQPARRPALLASLAWWTERVDAMIEGGGQDRDIHAARLKVEEYTERLYHLEVANHLHHVRDPESRASVLIGLAVADGSHTAAGAHERALQALRAEREARELAERERLAAQTDPQAAVGKLIEELSILPDSMRREIADAIGATVHVHGDAPVLAVVPPLPPDPGAVPKGRRVIGR